jgi:hypothetical protein
LMRYKVYFRRVPLSTRLGIARLRHGRFNRLRL